MKKVLFALYYKDYKDIDSTWKYFCALEHYDLAVGRCMDEEKNKIDSYICDGKVRFKNKDAAPKQGFEYKIVKFKG